MSDRTLAKATTRIAETRPSKTHVAGFLALGCVVGLLLAWLGSSLAETQRRPDPLNESGPWRVLLPSDGGDLRILGFSGDTGRLETGCGKFQYSYSQSGSSLTFADLPPTPNECVGVAAMSHTWFIGQLAQTATFTPAEFWRTSDTPTITFLDGSSEPLMSLTIDPRSGHAD